MKMKYTTIIFSILFFNNISAIFGWRWLCQSDKGICQRSQSEVLNNETYYLSQHVCRLVCGKYGALWPIPSVLTEIGKEIIYVHPDNFEVFVIQETWNSGEYFRDVANIFRHNLLKECGGHCSIPTTKNIGIFITIANHGVYLKPDVDESYTLNITTKGADTLIEISSPSVFGARHALETLSQLIASYTIGKDKGLAMVANAKIKDRPVYKHRGLLIDTARNYLAVSAIERQIDGMASCKMNVLHWHATDTQSFPLESKRVPQFSKYGPYAPHKNYSLETIASLKEYALKRGVRILLEIDSPSHAGNGWQFGEELNLGNLAVCVNQQPWRQYCIQPPCGQLNPANHKVYQVLTELYKDLLDRNTYQFHMGGDEVFINCWNSTQEIISYMEEKGWPRTTEGFFNLWSEFQSKNLESFDEAAEHSNTDIIVWSSQLTDIIEKYLQPKNRYIIETWVPSSNPLPSLLVNLGYRVIISTKNAWYMDHGFWGTTQYYTWRTVYNNRILRENGILGGEACMWGEYVDKSSLDSKIWPRVAAVGERLWSDPESHSGSAGVEIRFYRHRERLVARGISADAVTPAWCTVNEGQCI